MDFSVHLSVRPLFHRYNGSGSSCPEVHSSPRSTRPSVNSPGSTRAIHICMGDITYIDRLVCRHTFGNKYGTLFECTLFRLTCAS